MITEQHRKNIAKLVLWFKYRNRFKKLNFYIVYFVYNENESASVITLVGDYKTHPCETSCCFAGYGPQAGIEAKEYERWGEYIERCFTGVKESNLASPVYKFLFDEEHKNNAEAAMLRGAYFLEHGLPDVDEKLLTRKEAPNDYKPNWRLIKKIANS